MKFHQLFLNSCAAVLVLCGTTVAQTLLTSVVGEVAPDIVICEKNRKKTGRERSDSLPILTLAQSEVVARPAPKQPRANRRE